MKKFIFWLCAIGVGLAGIFILHFFCFGSNTIAAILGLIWGNVWAVLLIYFDYGKDFYRR